MTKQSTTVSSLMDIMAIDMLKSAKNMDVKEQVAIFSSVTKWYATKNKIDPGSEEGSAINEYIRKLNGGNAGGEGDTGSGEGERNYRPRTHCAHTKKARRQKEHREKDREAERRIAESLVNDNGPILAPGTPLASNDGFGGGLRPKSNGHNTARHNEADRSGNV